ncbi:MAG: RNase P subunit [Nitrososphaerales archaeon]|nr:RNase P subunit [Nitrososphaerales archaeon]
MKTRRDAKADAEKAARALLESSVKTSREDLALATKQADLARKVMLRYNVRFDYSLRRFVCRGCKKLIVPGVNARVRLGHGKPALLRVTCMMCGHTSRKILKMA